MKKFLTVLLVIAVMFTFSFSSAFATVTWTGETTSKNLTQVSDFLDTTPEGETNTDPGKEGITEAYRAELIASAEDELDYVKDNTIVVTPAQGDNPAVTDIVFYAPEKKEAEAAISSYLEALKTVKTAADAKKLTADLAKTVGTWDGTALTQAADGLPMATKVRTDATGTDGIATADATTSKINVTSKVKANANGIFAVYLPEYGTIATAVGIDVTGAPETGYFIAGTPAQIFAADATGVKKLVRDWFYDNDYRNKGDFKTGATAFKNALVVANTTYTDAVQKELDAIQAEIDKFVDTDEDSRRGLSASNIEAIAALVTKINDFEDKYVGLAGYGDKVGKAALKLAIYRTGNGVKECLAGNYFDQYYSEVSAVPAVKALTDADKANVQALYKKVNALYTDEKYADVWDFAGLTKTAALALAYDYDSKLKAAYDELLKKDVKAFKNLDTFSLYEKGTNGYYFDASEKNVNAVKAQRTAYDALVSGYGFADLKDAGANGMTYAAAADYEAKILAAEKNQTADAEYDVKDTSKIQAYLNNAIVKVTTKALGNRKIRVQARIDTATFEKLLNEMEVGSTVTYQFYHKTASATTYKAAKVKDVNYITYTSKSLKKGVKYKFQCKVQIKDASGNVVATKDYKASTIGSRICK